MLNRKRKIVQRVVYRLGYSLSCVVHLNSVCSASAPDVIPGIIAYLKGKLAENKVATPDLGIICGACVSTRPSADRSVVRRLGAVGPGSHADVAVHHSI